MTPDNPHALKLELDLDAISHNLALIRSMTDRAGTNQHFIASIKANAYGFGCIPVARHLQTLGVHSLATGSASEARALRDAGVTLPILLFAATPPEELAGLVSQGFVPTITSLEAAAHLSKDIDTAANVYVKVDMGFGRLGIPLAEAIESISTICALPNILIEGIYTHTPFGTKAGRDWAHTRLRAFDELLAELAARGIRPAISQARASGCVLAGLTDNANAICVGHALYGLSPFGPELEANPHLRLAMASLKTRLIQVVHHGQGADLAIAGQFGIEHATTIGVLPVGLGDGLARPLKDREAYVLVGGARARVLAVSLEHTTVELQENTRARAGDDVVLVGRQGDMTLQLDDLAAWAGRSQLETMMGLSGRVTELTGAPQASS